MKKIIYILCVLITLNISLIAKSDESEIDHLALATLMIYDAKYDKAKNELSLVDKTKPSYDASKYYTVDGVLNSKTKNHSEAVKSFIKAIEATKIKDFTKPKGSKREKYLFSIASSQEEEKKPELELEAKKIKEEKISKLYMYLSQEYYKLKDYKNTVISLDNAGESGRSKPLLYTLRAECYWKLKEHSSAFSSLNSGIKLFPKDATLQKQKFYYFADLKLYKAAIDSARVYITNVGGGVDEYIALAQMLIAANQTDEAITLLEEIKLKFDKEPKVGVLLAHMYLKKEMKHTTAYLFERSSYYDKKYLKDAVEMHRRSGNNQHALYLNAQNIDKSEKLKQKIAIYIDSLEFRKVIGLKKALNRYGMLDDDNLRYALAYSYYMSGDYINAEVHLKKISDNELFNKATVIRKNIEKCRNNTMECM